MDLLFFAGFEAAALPPNTRFDPPAVGVGSAGRLGSPGSADRNGVSWHVGISRFSDGVGSAGGGGPCGTAGAFPPIRCSCLRQGSPGQGTRGQVTI